MESQSADGERKPGPFLVILNALEVAFRHLPGKLFVKKKKARGKSIWQNPKVQDCKEKRELLSTGSAASGFRPLTRQMRGRTVQPGAARSRGHVPPVCSQDRTQDPIPWAQEASRLLATHPVRLRNIIHPSRDSSPLPSALKIR